MHTRYFRKKNPRCSADDIQWIEMTGCEFYQFVKSPDGKGRFFLDMGDVVLECTKSEYKQYKRELDHSRYILEQEAGWITMSLNDVSEDMNGEEVIADIEQDVEAMAIQNLLIKNLWTALQLLPTEDFILVRALFLDYPQKTIRQLSTESGIPVMTLQNRKLRIIRNLKKFF